MTASNTTALPIGSRGREDAAALMWRWQDRGDDAARVRTLQRKGWLQAAVGFLVMTALLGLGLLPLAVVAGVIATVTGLLASLSPLGAYARLQGRVTRLARGVGVVVGWIVLLPVFVLFFVPFGRLFRRGERDTLKRQLDPARPTYWHERAPDADLLARLPRQF